MYRGSQHYLALIRFPTLWGLLYIKPKIAKTRDPEKERKLATFRYRLGFRVQGLGLRV